MSGGTTEIHRDDDYALKATHKGGAGDAAFLNRAYKFDALVTVGLAAENYTTSTTGTVTAVTERTVTVSGCTWAPGDEIRIYKTGTKGGLISTQWTDLSRGWKTPMDELEDGWRPEDVDLNSDGEREVWGPGQPENYRR